MFWILVYFLLWCKCTISISTVYLQLCEYPNLLLYFHFLAHFICQFNHFLFLSPCLRCSLPPSLTLQLSLSLYSIKLWHNGVTLLYSTQHFKHLHLSCLHLINANCSPLLLCPVHSLLSLTIFHIKHNLDLEATNATRLKDCQKCASIWSPLQNAWAAATPLIVNSL